MQKKRSKDASKQVDLTASDALREQLREVRATQFQGYEDVQGAGAVVAIVQNGEVVQTAHEGDIVVLGMAELLTRSHFANLLSRN